MNKLIAGTWLTAGLIACASGCSSEPSDATTEEASSKTEALNGPVEMVRLALLIEPGRSPDPQEIVNGLPELNGYFAAAGIRFEFNPATDVVHATSAICQDGGALGRTIAGKVPLYNCGDDMSDGQIVHLSGFQPMHMAHEIGHFFGLSHVHVEGRVLQASDCPSDNPNCDTAAALVKARIDRTTTIPASVLATGNDILKEVMDGDGLADTEATIQTWPLRCGPSIPSCLEVCMTAQPKVPVTVTFSSGQTQTYLFPVGRGNMMGYDGCVNLAHSFSPTQNDIMRNNLLTVHAKLRNGGLVWNGWQSLGESSTKPVGAAAFAGFMHLFAIESNSTIAHNSTQDGSPWSSWTHELSGTTNVAISATPFAGFLHLFAKGAGDGRVYHSFAAQGQPFSSWSNEISGTTNVPLAAAGLGNHLHLFRLDTSNVLMHSAAASGQPFGAWEQLDGNTNVAVAASSLGTHLHVFAKGATDKLVYHRSAADGQPFGGWESMGATTNLAPAATTVKAGASGGNDSMLLLRVGTDKHIYYRIAADGSPFSDWLEIPGGQTTSVAVGAAQLGSNTYVFATGTDGNVRVNAAHL